MKLMKRAVALTMAAMLCASSACAEGLDLGDKGGRVLKVQEQLIEKGYLNVEADGMYGRATADAVRKFQEEHGLEVTGIVDELTNEKILSEETVSTKQVQQKLIELGYLDGAADGIMGAATSGALGVFQQEHGLEVTGTIDDATCEALFAGENTSEAEPEEETDPIVRAQERLIELGYLSGRADGDFGILSKEALRQFQLANGLTADAELGEESLEKLFSDDAKGDEPRMIQNRLIKLGYLTGSADGILGAKSIAAIEKFQQLHNLEVTGEVNEETWSLLFSDSVTIIRPALYSGSEGESVKALQQRLIDFGFLNTGADGDYGENTFNAVYAFQEHLNAQGIEMEIDGGASSELQEYLFSEDYSSYISDVRLGDENPEVRRIERQLRNLGYMDGRPNEEMDDYAVECVKAFQREAGLTVTGVADKETQDALFAMNAVKAELYVYRDVELGDEGAVIQQAQEALIRLGLLSGQTDDEYGSKMEDALSYLHGYLAANGSERAELFSAQGKLIAAAQKALQDDSLMPFSAVIDADSDEAEIKRVQNRLSNLFYYVGGAGADGKYGQSTTEAMEKFQQENSLPVTGIADEETQKVLFSKAALGNWTPYKLVVSIDKQRVYAYKLNAAREYELVETFICSTGLNDTTPRGIFSATTEPLDRWHYFYNFECWAQYAWKIVDDYYFHSVIYDEKDESTLRWGSVYALGHKASHGCIRLEVEAARWIYEHCEAGTIVSIEN